MNGRTSRWSIALALAAVAAIALASLVALHVAKPAGPGEKLENEVTRPSEELWPPSLDCAFHDFMRTSTVVAFYFDVVPANAEGPRFYERAIVASDGKRTNFAGSERPNWTYVRDGDGTQKITSPDGATVIVLYGLKLGTAGVFNIEAGIRSNEYRNLGGECRQTNLAGP